MAANTNSPKANLEESIRESAKLINEYEGILRLSSDPKEKARAERGMAEQKTYIQDALQRYVSLCRTLNVSMEQDITELVYLMGIEIPKVESTSGVLVSTVPASTFNPNQVDKGNLRKEMVKAYPQPDFELLCLDLGKRYDLLRGSTLELKIAYLIEDTWDTPRYADLVQKVITDHPHLKDRLS